MSASNWFDLCVAAELGVPHEPHAYSTPEPSGCPGYAAPSPEDVPIGAMSTTQLRRRVQDTDGVVFTEHPSGRWVMEDDPDSYRRLIDTWDSYEQLLGDAVDLTELEPAPAYTDDEIGDEWRERAEVTPQAASKPTGDIFDQILAVPCPACKAPAGTVCEGRDRRWSHINRRSAAAS